MAPAAPQQTRLPGPVQAIAWNADCSSVAVSHCGNDVIIYDATASSAGPLTWSRVAVLEGHHQMVSGLDWASRADQILSCSHDRNAFVWMRTRPAGPPKPAAALPGASTGISANTLQSPGRPGPQRTACPGPGPGPRAGRSAPAPEPASTSGLGAATTGWQKQMVITRLTKGALCVRWSPSEAKFAIGSAARVVSVGYYDPESKWWACKMIRKAHESSVVSVAWHPNSLLLATGSTDRRVRLFNAYVPGYEPEAPAGALPPNCSFGDCLLEVAHEDCGWVHAVLWSPGDEALMYASHDAVVGYVRGPQAQVAVRLSGVAQLPLKCLAVVSERLAVGAGWEGCLLVLKRRSLQEPWEQAGVLGGSAATGSAGGDNSGGGGGGGGPTAGGVVRQLAQMHVGGGASLKSPGFKSAGGIVQSSSSIGHTACVTGLHARPVPSGPGTGWHVASAGLDGQVILWDLSSYL